jgi:predicted TIM-barrel fold metal-dependent hydrolase
MDIVDAQVHLNLTFNTKQLLAAMDSLGIQGVIVDEFWGLDEHTHRALPGFPLPNGAYRATAPGAEDAGLRYPDRISYVLRVDPNDPDLAAVIRTVAAAPNARGLRHVVRTDPTIRAMANGELTDYLALAGKYRLPVCLFCPDNVQLVRPVVERQPDTTIVLDHIAMPVDDAQFEEVLRLAELPNVVIKWGHGPAIFHADQYPFDPMFPYLRRCLDVFGPQRVMWASDFTAIAAGHRWADELFAVRESDVLAQSDKEWLLGRTAREVFQWPAPAVLAAPPIIEH